MADEDPKDTPIPTHRGRPIFLSAKQRVGLCVSGVALLGTAGWAQIASGHDGAGTVAFVAAGAIAGALGLIGRLPNRLSGKDYTVEFEVEQRVKEVVTDIVEELPTEAKKAIAEAPNPPMTGETGVGDLGKIKLRYPLYKGGTLLQGFPGMIAARSLQFEDVIVTTLEGLFKAHVGAGEVQLELVSDGTMDAVLVVRGERIGIQAKARELTNDEIHRVLAMMKRLYVPGMIYVTESASLFTRNDVFRKFDGYPDKRFLERLVVQFLAVEPEPD